MKFIDYNLDTYFGVKISLLCFIQFRMGLSEAAHGRGMEGVGGQKGPYLNSIKHILKLWAIAQLHLS